MLKKKLFWLLPLCLTAPSNAFGVDPYCKSYGEDESVMLKAPDSPFQGDASQGDEFRIRKTKLKLTTRGKEERTVSIGKFQSFSQLDGECHIMKLPMRDDNGKVIDNGVPIYQYFVPLDITWQKINQFAKKNFNSSFSKGFSEINFFLHSCMSMIKKGEIIDLDKGYKSKTIAKEKEIFCKMIKSLAEYYMDPKNKQNKKYFFNLTETLRPEEIISTEGKIVKQSLINDAVFKKNKEGAPAVSYLTGISIDTKTGEQLNPNVVSGGVRIPIQILHKEEDRAKKLEEAKKYHQELLQLRHVEHLRNLEESHFSNRIEIDSSAGQ